MSSAEPVVSVIVPCYRAEGTLRSCLEALVRQSGCPALEVIVVDNGSDDGTRDIAETMAAAHPDVVRVLEELTPGAYAARSRGLEAARGRFVLFTDADCRPTSSWVARMAQELGDPEVLMAGGEVCAAEGARSLVSRYSARENILSQAHTLRHPGGGFLQTANLGVRTERAREVGFDASLFSGGDADFCWRLRVRWPDGAMRLVTGAIVDHVHRETLPDLFRQYRRYGQSDVLLARKHGAAPIHAGVKLLTDVLRVFLAPCLGLLLLPVAIVKRDAVVSAAPILRAVRVLGRRRGQLQALLWPQRLHRV